MSRFQRGAARSIVAGVLLALACGSLPATAAPAAPGAPAAAESNGSMVMVLDSSGSMKDDDGSGTPRIEAARKAIGTVVDSLPEGYPTGLRVYGADKTTGCDDTRLVKPVEALDRDGIKQAVADVKPKGDTPIGLSLRKAGADLPKAKNGALSHRTILLISDGEDNCGDPDPCQVAAELGKQGIDLRIDTIGFQVRGKARKELECIAEAGHGSYYDAPDAAALARQLERAGQLSADGYRFKGKPITAGLEASGAETILPGQYLDSIGPGETKWYAAQLDAESAADFGVTAVPQPGVKVTYGDGIDIKLTGTDQFTSQCDRKDDTFRQDEGAKILTNAVSRIPSPDKDDACDAEGRYLLSVSRASDAASDQARWPLELAFGLEAPLKKGTVPAQSETEYAEVKLPAGSPKDITGGTGFNDAKELGAGVWRDQLLPAQTRFYRVPVTWGQQLRYRVEFANEPKLKDASGVSSYVDTDLYAPSRGIIGDGPYSSSKNYYGEPVAAELGSVPVSWTNRWENDSPVVPVRSEGEYVIAVSLGPNAAQFAENASIGVVLRVELAGQAKAGPQHKAPLLKAQQSKKSARQAAEKDGDDSSSLPLIAGLGGGAALLVAVLAWVIARSRRTTADNRNSRGGL